MTAAVLLAYICAALLVQLVAVISIALWRRWSRASPVQRTPPVEEMPTNGWPGWRELRVVRRDFEDAAQAQCSFYLEPVDGAPLPPFLPGQFLTFELNTGEAHTVTRCYSLSDRPYPTGYRVTVKRLVSPAEPSKIPHGVASCHFHDRIQEGDVLRVKAPTGAFVIDPDETIPVVLIAGGIGITPLLSMLLWCVSEQPKRSVHLYYGIRNHLEHAFKAVLEALAASQPTFRLHVAYSRPGLDDTKGRDFEHEGHVDIEYLKQTLPNRRHQFYVCGPPPMMASLVPALEAWGIPKGDIHHEAFGAASVRATAPVRPPPGQQPIEVHFRRSGRTLPWQGEDTNLLDFAERHGIAVESGCRSGSCGSCAVRVLAGTVHTAQEPDHDIAEGHCLLCISSPASRLELEA